VKTLLTKLRRNRGNLHLARTCALVWGEWRVTAGVSLLLSAVILGLVLSVVGLSGLQVVASPLTDSPITDSAGGIGQDDVGFHVISVASTPGSEGASGPLIIVDAPHQTGPCALCTAADSSYDPEMGWFNVSLSVSATDQGFTFCRFPCMNDTHNTGPLTGAFF